MGASPRCVTSPYIFEDWRRVYEVFRPVADFPMYEVSNLSTVVNVKTGSYLRHRRSGAYYKVALYNEYGRRDYFVHRLVWEAFNPDTERHRQVKHHDNDTSNNILENLYLANHKVRNEKLPEETLGLAFKTRGRVRIIETGEEFPSIRMAGRAIRGEYSSIYACLRGERANHLGYTFEWIEE